jgi:co-chaperonin GroES (HSP10)
MVTTILNRVLVELEDLQRYHSVKMPNGTEMRIEVAYGDYEKRMQASVTKGTVIELGPDAYEDYASKKTNRVPKPGDVVQFAKYSGQPVLDPDAPERRLAVINDEDITVIIKSKENTNE